MLSSLKRKLITIFSASAVLLSILTLGVTTPASATPSYVSGATYNLSPTYRMGSGLVSSGGYLWTMAIRAGDDEVMLLQINKDTMALVSAVDAGNDGNGGGSAMTYYRLASDSVHVWLMMPSFTTGSPDVVKEYDGATAAYVRSIELPLTTQTLGGASSAMSLTSDGTYLWVLGTDPELTGGNRDTQFTYFQYRISDGTLLRKIMAASKTAPFTGAFIHSDGTNVWLVVGAAQTLYKFNIATLTTTGSVTFAGIGATVFSDGTHVFVSQKYSNTDVFHAVAGDKVFEYNTSNLALVRTISVDKNPYSIFSTGTSLWVSSWGSYPYGYGEDSAVAEYDTTTGALLSRSTATKTQPSPSWVKYSDLFVPYNVTVVGSTAYAFTGVLGDTGSNSYTYKVVKLAPAPAATIASNPVLGDMTGPSYAAGDQVAVMPGRWNNSTGAATVRLYRCDTNTVTTPATDSTCTVLANPLTSGYTIVSADAGKYFVATESITGLDGSTSTALSNFAKAAGGASSGGGGGTLTVCSTISFAVCDVAYTYTDWSKVTLTWSAPSGYPAGTVAGYKVYNLTNPSQVLCSTSASVQSCEVTLTPGVNAPPLGVAPLLPGNSLGAPATVMIQQVNVPQIIGWVGSTGLQLSPNLWSGTNPWTLSYTVNAHTCTMTYSVGTLSPVFSDDCADWTPDSSQFAPSSAPIESGWLTPSTTYQVTGSYSTSISTFTMTGPSSMDLNLPIKFSFTTLSAPQAAPSDVSYSSNGDGTYTVKWKVAAGTDGSGAGAVSTDHNYSCQAPPTLSNGFWSCIADTQDSSAPAPTDFYVFVSADRYSLLNPVSPPAGQNSNSGGVFARFDSFSWTSGSGLTSTPVIRVAPGSVASAAASAGNHSVTVTWSAPTTGDAPTSYEVSIPGQTTCVVNLVSNPSAPLSCTFSGLTNGTSYTATIVAKNGAGTSTGVTASATPVAPTPPGAPTGVTASAGNGQATISWTTPASAGSSAITSYTVTASPGGRTCTVNAPATTCTISGLTNGTAYTFTVTATSTSGTSAPSSASSSVSPQATAPSAPTNATAVSGEGQATISWSTPASDGGAAIDGYIVTSSPGGLTCTAVAPDTTCTITGLTNGTAYTFTVVASNNVGTSDPSSASNSVTPAAGPSAPDRAQVTPGNHSATINWKAPVDGATPIRYVVTMNPGGRTCTVDLVLHPSAALTCTFTGLTNGVNYSFTIAAFTANGMSASDTVYATPAAVPTKPSAPRGVKFRGSVAGVGTVTWKVSGSNGGSPITKYVVYVTGTRYAKSCTVNMAANPSATLSCSVSGLKPKRFYNFRVKAVNAYGQALSPKARQAIDTVIRVVSFGVGKTTMWSGLARQAFITAGYIKKFKYTQVTLTGYTNPGGTLAGRTRFTQARALTVANYFTRQLRAMGVRNVTVIAVGTGASIYKGPALTPLQRKKNRSVATLLSYK